MRKFGLIGYPLGHSFSKQYFSEKFQHEGIEDCEYENYPLPQLSRFSDLISENDDILGLNVTIPYKTDIIRFLDEIDKEAEEAGAVNTIKVVHSGANISLKGYNTDVYGFRESILPSLNKSIRSALILGTGGSSKAVAYVLHKLGIEVNLVSRNSQSGFMAYSELTEANFSENQLIVNTTPLGMFPDINTFPDIRYDFLKKNHILYDLIYNPEMTKFLQKGKERGCRIIGGKEMLILQAEKSWSIWNDKSI